MPITDKEHTCAFTSHRPERLNLPEAEVVAWLEKEIRRAVEEGYTQFITGMQRGVDLWAAEAVLKVRSEGKSIRLVKACAFKGMEEQWERVWQIRFRHILFAGNETYYISERPGRSAFFQRNKWMVDHASRLIAVYTGAPGGTKETDQYAKAQGLEVINITEETAG